MSQESTVFDNIATDFWWFPEAILWLSNLAPLVAIIWAINAYYRGRLDDRSDQLRAERRDLYRRYLMTLDERDEKQDGDLPISKGIRKLTKLAVVQTELSLIAPDDVWKIALELFPIILNTKETPAFVDGKPNPDYVKKADKEGSALRRCRRRLIEAMRKDLLQGSDVGAGLTDVEELQSKK